MGHVPSLCVHCSSCYSWWCYGQILAVAPLTTINVWERIGEKTLSTARGGGGVSTWYFHQIQVGMWAKLWDMSHLFVCVVALVIHGGAMAKFWPLHHYNQCMGENRRKTLSTGRGRGGVSTWYFHQIQVGNWAKLLDMSHLFVCFVALVIQGNVKAKFWPLHHYYPCMGENRNLAIAPPWITMATKHTKRWDMGHTLAHIPTSMW